MKNFPKKHLKNLPADFVDNVQSASKEEVQKKILEAEQHLYEIEDAVELDEELAKAKEALKEMGASYKESKSIETAKIKYLLWMMEQRGTEIGK